MLFRSSPDLSKAEIVGQCLASLRGRGCDLAAYLACLSQTGPPDERNTALVIVVEVVTLTLACVYGAFSLISRPRPRFSCSPPPSLPPSPSLSLSLYLYLSLPFSLPFSLSLTLSLSTSVSYFCCGCCLCVCLLTCLSLCAGSSLVSGSSRSYIYTPSRGILRYR